MAELSFDQMVESYIKIRDAKDNAKKAFDTETKRMTAALTKLDGLILKHLQDNGAEAIKTPFGTAFTKARSSVSVKDRDKFYNWAVQSNNLGAIDMKANSKVVRELLQDDIEVPGVKYTETTLVNVRRK